MGSIFGLLAVFLPDLHDAAKPQPAGETAKS
jgi:hypothetical protein